MEKGHLVIFIGLVVLLLLGGGGYWAYSHNFHNIRGIHSYEDCGKAGYPVMASYPGQCNTPDGQHFVEELSEEEKKRLAPPLIKDESQESEWKTYVSDDKVYSFMYPAGWEVKKSPNGNGVDVFNPKTIGRQTNGGGIISEPTEFVNLGEALEKNKTIKQIVDESVPKVDDPVADQFKRVAVKYKYLSGEAFYEGGEGSVGWEILLTDGKRIFSFTASMADPNEDSIEYKIIDSFKFLH